VWRTALHQKRPYLDLDDAVRAITFILERKHFPDGVFNVLSLNATVVDIVEAIRGYVPDLEVKQVDSPIMNQLSYEVANEKFRALGFQFQGNLKAQIGETISLIRQANSAA
jgi:UDP-glucose 4-epimerase